MVGAETSCMVKKVLETVCWSNGWSYGVFWSFDQRNSMMLTLADSYYEHHVREFVDDMLLQVHMLGEGIIGKAALTGRHRWIFSDAPRLERNPTITNQDIFEDYSEFHGQFSSGIKTVAVIPVEARGVLQFGSCQKILESPELLDGTKRLLSENVGVIRENSIPKSSNGECCDLDDLFASLISTGTIRCPSPVHNDGPSPLSNFSQLSGYMLEFLLSSKPSSSSSQTSILTSLDQPTTSVMREFDSGNDIRSIDNQLHSPLFPTTEDKFGDIPNHFATEISRFFSGNDLSHWFTSFPDHSSHGMTTALNNDLSHLVENDVFFDVPRGSPFVSEQSSVTDMISLSEGQGKSTIKDLFDNVGLDFGFGQAGESWEDIIMPETNGGCLPSCTGMSECISGLDVGRTSNNPQKRLFSELGLDKLLKGPDNTSSITKSGFEDRSCSKRGTESFRVSSNKVKLTRHSGSFESMNLTNPVYMLEKANSLLRKNEVVPKTPVGLWIDDNHSINVGSATLAEPQRLKEQVKALRKRAKPGESNRPRPKDRQQIQDRIKELRGIIPNGGKCSIDSLLDRTIKYMSFLQSVTSYVDKLKQVDDPKLIGHENGVLKEKSSTDDGGGVTWAFEVGDKTTVCPIIVEDLNPPGQMLIEMLFEECGFFLEVADMIRGLGLNILKGVMEIQENKIRGRFIVEANRHITRVEVFWSLVQFLQQTNNTSINSIDQPRNVSGIRLLDDFEKPNFLIPLN